MSAQTVFMVFLIFFIAKFMVQVILDYRNNGHVQMHKNKVPSEFADQIDLPDHKKAAEYTKAKSMFSRFDLAYSCIITLIWLTGGLEWIDSYARTYYPQSEIKSGLVFITIFSLIGMVLGLPFSLYKTFIIEEKFGFNKTTFSMFFSDMFKQVLLSALIGLPLFALILFIMESTGQYWWVLSWVVLMAFQFIMVWAYPRIIAPLFNKFSPLEDGELKSKIESLLEKTGFSSSGLFVMDASKRSGHGNAYFTGFGKSKRIVFFDTLINTLNPDEAEAVLAHELGHFKLKHIHKKIAMSFVTSLIGFAILGYLYNWPEFYQAFSSTKSTYMALILFTMVTPSFSFFLTPIFSALSRKHEFEADEFAAKNSNAKDLISALIKMYKDNASSLTPDPIYSKFYFSHPPAFERVKSLKQFTQ